MASFPGGLSRRLPVRIFLLTEHSLACLPNLITRELTLEYRCEYVSIEVAPGRSRGKAGVLSPVHYLPLSAGSRPRALRPILLGLPQIISRVELVRTDLGRSEPVLEHLKNRWQHLTYWQLHLTVPPQD